MIMLAMDRCTHHTSTDLASPFDRLPAVGTNDFRLAAANVWARRATTYLM
jgi:hypothetical protein